MNCSNIVDGKKCGYKLNDCGYDDWYCMKCGSNYHKGKLINLDSDGTIEHIENQMLVKLRGEDTQVARANKIGISQSSYRLFEIGMRIPSMPTMVKIARYYKLGVEDIWSEDEIENARAMRRKYG